MIETNQHTHLFDLSLDTKLIIIQHLDHRSLVNLSKTCTYFATLVRRILSFHSARIHTLYRPIPNLPPFLNFRVGATIGTTFYIPVLNESFCYAFDLIHETWSTRILKQPSGQVYPQITCIAAIGNNLYLVGGRLLESYTLSNSLIEIDVIAFTVHIVTHATGTWPRPRHEHSVNAIANRYLVIFGGLCYNSVGENDVYVYDTISSTWFVPDIIGQFPHLRFGHASAVIGNDLYIYSGAQMSAESSYIIYDDLYKLDCQTWTWYKYERPEVEQYFRSHPKRKEEEYVILTTGDNPHDRFKPIMCAFAGKLIMFGGHSIRTDEDDNEVLCHYPLNEILIFHTRRHSWLSRNTPMLDEQRVVWNMSASVMPHSQGAKVFIFAGHSLQKPEYNTSLELKEPYQRVTRSLDEYGLGHLEDTYSEVVDRNSKVIKLSGGYRRANNHERSEHVIQPFRLVNNDTQGEDYKKQKKEGSFSKSGYVDRKGKTRYSASHDSYEGYTNAKNQNSMTPCVIVLDLLE